jgi:hypothetical protein
VFHAQPFFLENLRWVRGSRFTEEKSKLADRDFSVKNFRFFFLNFFMCFGHKRQSKNNESNKIKPYRIKEVVLDFPNFYFSFDILRAFLSFILK